jgi:hypothetical protein
MGIAERLLAALSQITFQNVATIALLAVIAVPTYGFWQILHDKELRHDMLSSVQVIDAGVPCLVQSAQQAGQDERYTVGSSYLNEGKFERLIAVRAYGVMSKDEIKEACGLARSDADTLRKALAVTGIQPPQSK